MNEGKKSPLHQWHVAHGAELMWDDGYPWAVHEGGDHMIEYEAVRTGTGLLDLYSIFTFEVTGPDAAAYIQRTFTNNVADMKPGSVRYGAFVDHHGIMMDEGNIYKFSDDRYYLMINAPYVMDQMVPYTSGLQASVTNITDKYCMVGVQGPTAQATLQSFVERDLELLKYFQFWPEPTTIAGHTGWVSRTGYSGEKGYEVWVETQNALDLWTKLCETGGVPFGVNAIEIARVESGLMLIYIDYQLNALSPYDLSMDKFIKFHPDCVGTPALMDYGENPPKRFKTLKVEGTVTPERQTPVYQKGKEVGVLTSPVLSPRLGVISLAIIDTAASEDGTILEVMIDSTPVKAEVATLSLYDPQRKRARS